MTPSGDKRDVTPNGVNSAATPRRCIQHGTDYSAICPICGPWRREMMTPREIRNLKIIAATIRGSHGD